ncbi:MAG: hypothetical protein R3E79_26265 [Caldilineaceae bacterium]
MLSLQQAVTQWLQEAEGKAVTPEELQGLRQIVQRATPRQRLLYLHAHAVDHGADYRHGAT